MRNFNVYKKKTVLSWYFSLFISKYLFSTTFLPFANRDIRYLCWYLHHHPINPHDSFTLLAEKFSIGCCVCLFYKAVYFYLFYLFIFNNYQATVMDLLSSYSTAFLSMLMGFLCLLILKCILSHGYLYFHLTGPCCSCSYVSESH